MYALHSKFAKSAATLVIVASVFGPNSPLPLSVAHAQEVTGGGGASAGATVTAAPTPTTSTTNTTGQVTTTGGTTASANTTSTPTGTDLQCSTSNIAVCISGFVYWVTVGLGTWFANITAYIFDYAVQLSLQSGAYALDFIAIGWKIAASLANMMFLFIVLYIGFKIMFQVETAGTIRMLVWVVIIALLVNFSFLFTRLVIDGGNIVALQFYNAIAPPGAGTPTIQNPSGTTGSGTGSGTQTADITASIMNAINPQNILGTEGFKNFVADKNGSQMYYLIVSSVIYILVGVTLFMLAATFIFAAIRFMMRIIGLWCVIIAAPIAFVGAIFRGKEGGAKLFNKWLGYLLELSFYPAVFLFMYYIEVRFATEMGSSAIFNNVFNAAAANSAANPQGWSAIVQASANVGVRLGFILASMALILRASQWMGGAFNDLGTKWAQDGLLRLGRNTVKLTTKPIRGGIQAQANAATRSGVNAGLWRGLNRVTGGTNQARSTPFTLRSALSSQGTKQGATITGARGLLNRFRGGNQQPAQTGAQPQQQAANQPQQAQPTVAAAQQATRAQAQANVNSLYRAARRESGQPNDITTAQPVAIPTGARRLPGGAKINQVQGGNTGLGEGTKAGVRGLYAQHAGETMAGMTKSKNAIDELYKEAKAERTAARGAYADTASPTTSVIPSEPNMSGTPAAQASATPPPVPAATPAQPTTRSEAELLDTMKSLLRENNQSVREILSGIKSTAPATPKVVISSPSHIAASSTHVSVDYDKLKEVVKKAVKKEFGNFEPHGPNGPGPTTPSPAAPAAARPTPPASNENHPFSQAAE